MKGFTPLEIIRLRQMPPSRPRREGGFLTGFTLIETVVVIAIVVLLLTMVLAYSRSSEKQIVLFRDQAVIVGVLNRAKALTIEKFNENPNNCGFGVYFESPQTFILFQDLKAGGGDEIFGCRNDDGSYNSNFDYDAGDEAFEQFSLDKRLTFEIQGGVDKAAIVFMPPELRVASTIALPITITLSISGNGGSQSITIGEAGQVVTQ